MAWNTTDLDELPVYEKLMKLARDPFDLTAPGAVSPERISSYRASAAGFDLLYSTQRLDGTVFPHHNSCGIAVDRSNHCEALR